MQLPDQVCTLEQAKRLKELGVTQESYFMWQESGAPEEYMPQETIGRYEKEAFEFIGIASAYTVAELGEMLPQGYHTYNTGFPGEGEWGAMDDNDEAVTYADLTCIMATTEAQCRAAMLIYLIENNLVSVAEINNQLTPPCGE